MINHLPYTDKNSGQSKPPGDYTGIDFHYTMKTILIDRHLTNKVEHSGERANYVYAKIGTRKPKTAM